MPKKGKGGKKNEGYEDMTVKYAGLLPPKAAVNLKKLGKREAVVSR